MRFTRTVVFCLATALAISAVGTSEAQAQCAIGSLNFSNSATFSWAPPGGTCPASYDVAFGVFPPWRIGNPALANPLDLTLAPCGIDNTSATTVADTTLMPVGTGRWYLVRANNPFIPLNTWNETLGSQVYGRDAGALLATCPF